LNKPPPPTDQPTNQPTNQPIDSHSALTNTEPKTATGPSLAGCRIAELLADEDVPGMHLLCVQRTPTGLFATAFMDGRNASSAAGPITASAPAEDFQALRTTLEKAMGLAPEGRRDPNGPRGQATPNTFQPWALFTPQGLAVESLLDLAEGANDVLLFEGGSFIWPGVREGHVTRVTGVDGLENVAMRTLSMSPLVFSVEGFLRPEECRHIRERSAPHMAQSGVSLMDKDKGKAATEWRTSSTYFLPSYGDKTLQSIDRRVADLTRQPVTHQEDVQVLRYDNTQRCGAGVGVCVCVCFGGGCWVICAVCAVCALMRRSLGLDHGSH
jgi:prolyl 4-hydroxylase